MPARPSLRRSVLGPLSLSLGILLAVFTAMLYLGQRRHLDEALARDHVSDERFFRIKLMEDAELMGATLFALSRDPLLRRAFEARDRAALHARALPVFNSLMSRHRITHMY
ncbi:MAG: hypothetical protein ACREMA_21080, partial [Longimicrobiales bacterium]